ncbi:phage regulatory CII family protein [Aeromonas salmonicida]|uniref:phage regulatory CII family protein n=1 Tax=Aeromonas salmonicida TaxID=645 RepID=UPI00259F0076|nr:phage regulatory CII family protein [Aeromonas salmonicida]MDM5066024.1 phage regulatory CII family protein [Aeromonas salmonicida]
MFEQTATKQPHLDAACALFAARYSIADIAREAGIGDQMLRNKLNQDQPHQLTVRDLVALYRATGDDTLFDGLLFDCGLTAVRLPAAATAAPEARAQQALNASAQIMGVTAQATTILAGDRITKSNRNTVVTGIWAGIEHLVLIATEVENKFQAVPGLACAADMARAALGA